MGLHSEALSLLLGLLPVILLEILSIKLGSSFTFELSLISSFFSEEEEDEEDDELEDDEEETVFFLISEGCLITISLSAVGRGPLSGHLAPEWIWLAF